MIEPLLPLEPAQPKGGRLRVDDRAALAGIIFVLHSGISREMLLAEIGCSGMPCWHRLRDWQAAVCGRACISSCWSAWRMPTSSIGAGPRSAPRPSRLKGGAATGQNPTDRGKPGAKHHGVVDLTGTPLDLILSGANRHGLPKGQTSQAAR